MSPYLRERSEPPSSCVSVQESEEIKVHQPGEQEQNLWPQSFSASTQTVTSSSSSSTSSSSSSSQRKRVTVSTENKATMAALYYLPSACYSLMHYSTARPGKVRARGQRRFQAKSGRRTSGSQIQCAGLISDYPSGQTLLYLVTSTRVLNEAVPPPSASRRTGSLSANQGLSIPAAPRRSHHSHHQSAVAPEPRKNHLVERSENVVPR